jgi:excisionase family DNA binding protein
MRAEDTSSRTPATLDEIRELLQTELAAALNRNCRCGNSQTSASQIIGKKLFLSVKEAAVESGLGTSTIRLYIRKGQLCANKVGRRTIINRTDLENFLRRKPLRAVKLTERLG